ncbi:Transmembrane protein [Phytophthora palmivora]|uniref:Transmembrane protein n=1 Tax=Phytophthora palmivora TaxID=4796 RepID=A0A2P4X7C4_9STRA|nr:Transmembrane protein [Phytophthora palmivora]
MDTSTTTPQANPKSTTLAVASPNNFQEIKTPNADDLEGGALRPGGPPNIYSRETIGILIQYGALGVINGTIYGLVYPFLNNYLRMSGTATASARVLVRIPWTFRMFFGILSDCFPIWGFRRRPYMVFGWIFATICLLLMVIFPTGDPYYGDPDLAYVATAKLTDDQLALINEDAPDAGTKFILLMILANLGMAMAIAASDGVVIEFAQREPTEIRGSSLTMMQVFKQVMSILSSAMVGFGLNGEDFGGSFSGSMGVNAIAAVCAAAALIAAVSSWFFVSETKETARSFREYMHLLFDLLQHRVVYQLIAFRFFYFVFSLMSVTAVSPIASLWAKVEPVNDAISSILAALISAVSLYMIKRYGLTWNWRTLIVITQISVTVVDCFPSFFTIWNVYRSQWMWLGPPLLEEVPGTISKIVSQYATIEIVEGGNEAAVYGLITTCQTIASPFSTVIYKNIDAHFDIGKAYLQVDDTYVRNQVTYCYLIAYAFQICAIAWVFLLPRQKAETQELKRTGGKSKLAGIITIVVFTFCFVWSIMTNLMTIFPSTSCLKIAGGTGC